MDRTRSEALRGRAEEREHNQEAIGEKMGRPKGSKLSRVKWLGPSGITWLVALVVLLNAFQSTAAQRDWTAADTSVVRLSPTAFPQLPKSIAHDLAVRNCKVPQPFDATGTSNVIRGEFMRRGQMDWAVLCSHNRTSWILVFWNGSIKNVAKIAEAPDLNFLQIIDGIGTIGYSRSIIAVNKDYILQHYRWYGGPKPRSEEHTSELQSRLHLV